jgi:hypothetical protein
MKVFGIEVKLDSSGQLICNDCQRPIEIGHPVAFNAETGEIYHHESLPRGCSLSDVGRVGVFKGDHIELTLFDAGDALL